MGPVEECPHRAHEGERIEPAGLAAGAGRQQHEAVGARLHRALGMADGGDIGEHERAGVMQRLEHRRGRADRGDDDLRPVPQQHLRDPRRAARWSDARSGSGRPAPRSLIRAQSGVSISVSHASSSSGTAAIHRRKRADHAVAAGGDHELDAGDQKHRRRDQRQAETVAKARQGIGGLQRHSSLLALLPEIGTLDVKDKPSLARATADDKMTRGERT